MIYYTPYIRYDVPYNTYYKLDAMYLIIYNYAQNHILHIIYWAGGQGPGPLAQGPIYGVHLESQFYFRVEFLES